MEENQQPGVEEVSDKDWLTVLLLAWLVGVFGVDRFYTGSTGLGIGKLLTGGGCGIWAIVDIILVLTGKYKDSEGKVVKQKK